MRKKWTEIQSILEKRLGACQVKVWIAPLQPELNGSRLIFHAPTEFAATHVRTWFLPHLAEVSSMVFGSACSVSIECRQKSPGEAPAPHKLILGAADISASANAAFLATGQKASDAAERQALAADNGGTPSPYPLSSVQLALPMSDYDEKICVMNQGWRFSFEDFVVGPCNEFAYAASRSMCGHHAQSDILFLCSAPGLGKTHLTHAIGKGISSACNRARPKVEYLTAEEFTSRFFYALKAKDTGQFKARFRDLDLLLLEDVHFLQGKEKTQAELLATVKALRERGARVIFTSSFAPKDLREMDEQLLSRFSAGLLSFIDRPDEETRRRILRHKASLYQVLLPEEVETLLARHIYADVRRIESCLHTLILKAQLLNSRITLQMAWDVIAQYSAQAPVLDIDAIIGSVCRAFSLAPEQLLSSGRKQEHVRARALAFYLARKHTDLSLEAIGRRFNRRHSTVLKGITSLEREIKNQSPEGRQLAGILSMIEQQGNIAVWQ